MKVKPEQLAEHLQTGLAPVYMVYGDEPLLVQEACDAVRAAAGQQRYNERTVMHADAGFDWEALRHGADNLSLFAERRLIDLRLPGGKPGQAGAKVLADVAAHPPADTVLLISAGKLDTGVQNNAWFKAVERSGVVVQVWPVNSARLPAWIAGRMRAKGMQSDKAAVSMLAERTEGNLLAAMQEIEKLSLLYGRARISADDVATAVTGSARYNIYGLVDTAMAGDTARVVRILNGLRGEGVEPVLVLWAFAREIRALHAMAFEHSRGQSLDKVLAQHRIWERRKGLVKACLKRYPSRKWSEMLQHAARIDRIIKGLQSGRVWDELLQLSTTLAGLPSRAA